MASVTLEPMSPVEFAAFWEESFQHHVRELTEQEGLSQEQARAETERELSEMLPDGLDTPDNYLLTVCAGGRNVGFLWFLTELHKNTRQAFLCDFAIHPTERRKGYAQSALEKWEAKAHSLGCRECVLFVSDTNPAARALYDKCGYRAARKHGYGEYRIKCI